MSEEFSPELLLSKRLAAGMSRNKLSQLAKVASETIRQLELGASKPTPKTWERIQNGLKGLVSLSVRRVDTWCPYKPPQPPKPPRFSFSVGHVYNIRDNLMGGQNADWINPQYGTLCVFRYEGQQGIHHCFREASGGWTRTYTDAQLVGKRIEEVRE